MGDMNNQTTPLDTYTTNILHGYRGIGEILWKSGCKKVHWRAA